MEAKRGANDPCIASHEDESMSGLERPLDVMKMLVGEALITPSPKCIYTFKYEMRDCSRTGEILRTKF